ncbi:uncharacterized protein Smp_203010 [Schistosoma mansoni]|uniref:Smp_203010 n=1 Tax=Schistosoma mansoni TaxID=6183 RepID=G4VM61_SCHMA|nr:uncharacterized protein Smp_203010 [Schistosoma mansoni]|eukprot:XP_018653165.1 uncharacterized protein Smp_203010 [Schistosoma mansoni]
MELDLSLSIHVFMPNICFHEWMHMLYSIHPSFTDTSYAHGFSSPLIFSVFTLLNIITLSNQICVCNCSRTFL